MESTLHCEMGKIDPEEQKRKWRQKKQKQRAQLKNDVQRYDRLKRHDKERKAQERKKDRQRAKKDRVFREELRRRKREQQRSYREKKAAQNRQLKEQGSSVPSSARQQAAKKSHRKRKNRENMHKRRSEQKLKEVQHRKEVLRVKNYRLRIRLQSQKEDKQRDSEIRDNFKSPKAKWRAVKKVKDVMPTTPLKKAEIIEQLSQSPRSHKLLAAKGLFMTKEAKTSAEIGESLMEIISKQGEEVKSRGTTSKVKSHAYHVLRTTMLKSMNAKQKKNISAIVKAKMQGKLNLKSSKNSTELVNLGGHQKSENYEKIGYR